MPSKRSSGEGSYQKLSSGKWRGQIMDGYTELGKRKIVSFTGLTKADVAMQIQEYRLRKEKDNGEEKPDFTFEEWATTWYAGYKTQVAVSTYDSYQYTLKLLIAELGKRKLNSIKTIEVNRLLSGLLSKGYSDSQINKCRVMMIQIFDAAESNDYVPKNYARFSFKRNRSAESLAISNEKNEKDAFTPKEFSTLMCDLPCNLLGNSIRVLLVTGLRVQELLALTRDDIEEDGSIIRVTKAVKTVHGNPLLGTTKSERSVRDIPVAKCYRGIVVALREQGGRAFIWTSSRDNLLYSVGTFRRQYYRMLSKMPFVRHLSPHCCRHTYVTMLQRAGVPLETIARLTGHTDIQTTETYLHIGMDTLYASVEKLGADIEIA